MGKYVFDAARLVDEQRDAMQRCLDPITVERLRALGVGPGWRCLEVGGGGGSIARWLGEQVGDTGSVLVTDVDPSGMSGSGGVSGNVEVRRHDIVVDELPAAEFDLVHARLVLLHLPERHLALERMIRSLRPGGWLLLGEFDCTWMPVLSAPDADAVRLFGGFHAALCKLLSEAGADVAWGAHAYGALRDHGLVDVDSRAHAEPWPGGGDGARWLRVNSLQLEKRMVATGLVDEDELESLRALLADPAFVVSSYLTISAWGRRPDA